MKYKGTLNGDKIVVVYRGRYYALIKTSPLRVRLRLLSPEETMQGIREGIL